MNFIYFPLAEILENSYYSYCKQTKINALYLEKSLNGLYLAFCMSLIGRLYEKIMAFFITTGSKSEKYLIKCHPLRNIMIF